MTPEEFVVKHFDVLREALSVYRNRMEDNAGAMVEAARRNPNNKTFSDLGATFVEQGEAGKAASDDLWKLAQKMGKF